MEWMCRLEAVERRAARLNVSLNRVCMKAGVPRNNLTRWKSGMSAKISTFERDMARLEAALEEMESEMRSALKREAGPKTNGACEVRGVSTA